MVINLKFSPKLFAICFLSGIWLNNFFHNSKKFTYLVCIFLVTMSLLGFSYFFINPKFTQLKQLLLELNFIFLTIGIGFFWMLTNIYNFKKNHNLIYIVENKSILVTAEILATAISNVGVVNRLDLHPINSSNKLPKILRLDVKIKQVLGDYRVDELLDISKLLNNVKIRVTWFNPNFKVLPGDLWQLSLKLKKPRNFATVGSFDLERHCFSKRFTMLGVVLKSISNKLIVSHKCTCLSDKIRQWVIEDLNFLANQWGVKKKALSLLYY